MGSFSGMASTFDLPNYGGDLIQVSPEDVPFLTAIGGLAADSPDMVVTSTEFSWQTEDLAAPAQPSIVEGADPVVEERTRAHISNLVQIFQYGIKVTYSKLAAYNQLAQLGMGSANPVQDELQHQIDLKLRTARRDVNYTLLRGAYNKPANNAAARRTRGLVSAITTNVIANGTATALDKAMVNSLLRTVYDARGINTDLEPTFIVNSFQKQRLSEIFITGGNYRETSRTVGGVNLTRLETDFGPINVMLERNASQSELVFCHLRVCKPRFLLIPGKGFLFVEPLAKTGAYESYQLYGEIGLSYGDEAQHGKITNLTTS